MMRPTNMVITVAGPQLIKVIFENNRAQCEILASPAMLERWAAEMADRAALAQGRATDGQKGRGPR